MKISWWSKLWNWWFWVWHKKDKQLFKTILKEPFGGDWQMTLTDVINLIEEFKYESDWPLIHWTQRPETTLHRKKGDCEDFALLWYDQLGRMGYDPHIYKLYRQTVWTLWRSFWWHTVTIMESNSDAHIFRVTWHLFSNNKSYKVYDGYDTLRRVIEDSVLNAHYKGKYCSMRRLSDETILPN